MSLRSVEVDRYLDESTSTGRTTEGAGVESSQSLGTSDTQESQTLPGGVGVGEELRRRDG